MTGNVQEVTLTPLTGGPGKNWKVSHKGQQGSDPGTFPVIDLPAKTGPWLLHFKIDGPNSIKFAAGDPIAVQAGSKPTGSGLDQQIAAVFPTSDGHELFVVDRNDGSSSKLFYKMNFTGHGSLDPIIDNGGGNRFLELSLPELAAVGAGLLLALVVGMFVQKKFRLFG